MYVTGIVIVTCMVVVESISEADVLLLANVSVTEVIEELESDNEAMLLDIETLVNSPLLDKEYDTVVVEELVDSAVTDVDEELLLPLTGSVEAL